MFYNNHPRNYFFKIPYLLKFYAFIWFYTLSYAFHMLSYTFHMLSYTFICFSYAFICFSYAFICFHTLFMLIHGIDALLWCFASCWRINCHHKKMLTASLVLTGFYLRKPVKRWIYRSGDLDGLVYQASVSFPPQLKNLTVALPVEEAAVWSPSQALAQEHFFLHHHLDATSAHHHRLLL